MFLWCLCFLTKSLCPEPCILDSVLLTHRNSLESTKNFLDVKCNTYFSLCPPWQFYSTQPCWLHWECWFLHGCPFLFLCSLSVGTYCLLPGLFPLPTSHIEACLRFFWRLSLIILSLFLLPRWADPSPLASPFSWTTEPDSPHVSYPLIQLLPASGRPSPIVSYQNLTHA